MQASAHGEFGATWMAEADPASRSGSTIVKASRRTIVSVCKWGWGLVGGQQQQRQTALDAKGEDARRQGGSRSRRACPSRQYGSGQAGREGERPCMPEVIRRLLLDFVVGCYPEACSSNTLQRRHWGQLPNSRPPARVKCAWGTFSWHAAAVTGDSTAAGARLECVCGCFAGAVPLPPLACCTCTVSRPRSSAAIREEARRRVAQGTHAGWGDGVTPSAMGGDIHESEGCARRLQEVEAPSTIGAARHTAL